MPHSHHLRRRPRSLSLLSLLVTPAVLVCLAATAQSEPATPARPSTEATEPQAGKSPPAPPQSPDLRPHFQPGRKSRFELWRHGESHRRETVSGQQSERHGSFDLTGEITWEVLRVQPDGTAICQMTIDWIRVVDTDSSGETEVNDSRQATAGSERIYSILKAVAGEPVRVTVNASGRVESVDGVDSIQDKLGRGDSDPEISYIIDYKSLAATLAIVPAPAGQVKPEDTWRHPLSRDSFMGTIEEEFSYQLAGTELIAGIPVATVEARAKARLTPSSRLAERLNLRMTDGETISQFMVDLQRHEVVGSNIIQRYTLDMHRTLRPDLTIRITNRIEIQSQVLRIAESDASD